MISGVNDMFLFAAVLSVLLTAVMLITVIYEGRNFDERFRGFGRRNIRNNISE